jgi:hypothetical protein
VCVYSPADFHYRDVGWVPARGIWCDRSAWLASDLEAAYGEFTRALTAAFDEQTTGGLTVASSAWSDGDLLEAARAGRLLEVLR